ncbi:MAG: hypothetical protein M3015_14025 [Bacteroidota bacterium]|nr:hypothetical protein [Bacteroidota bacterium]
MTIKADKGIDISEATGVHFKNVKLITNDIDPVADISNSNDVSFDKFIFPAPAELLFRIGGKRAGNISMVNSATDAAKQKSSSDSERKKRL